jgi:hypothetical protein
LILAIGGQEFRFGRFDSEKKIKWLSFTSVNQDHATQYTKKKAFHSRPPLGLDHALCGLADPFSLILEDGRN